MLIIAFAGNIASGKSTISQGIADILDWPLASFGDYVRHVTKQRGLEESREVLQDTGQSLINEGWYKFCWSVLQQAHWTQGKPLIIDGIRHVEALNTLRQITFPDKVLLVFIELEDTARETRLRKRQPHTKNDLNELENHSTETQVKTLLPQIADLTVCNDKTTDETIHEILNWIKKIQ